ncbi:hypothetical protein [Nesterenkonia sp. NBAIMH1]|uniref:variant leucine-rich repeat-containing protein n=1 Tax=Nesterenkonia sp. NBAIMH1 TaxID=2600320 RepID=UPI0011B378B2|nr:hypothetical protein [Nesterenkonia sp. NBAIMH1]
MTDGPKGPRAQAQDPSTSAQELYELAASHPEVRPQIAEHPNAYPGLLDWLGSLGDPDVDAALASRSGPGEDQPTQALSTGSSDPQQTEEFGAVHHGQPAPHGTPPWEDQTAAYPAQQHAQEHQQQGYYPAAPVGAPPGQYPPAGYESVEQPSREERRSPAGICAIIALLVLLVIGALVALWVLFFSGDDEDEPVDDQAQEQPEEQDEEQELSPEDGQEDPDASQTVTRRRSASTKRTESSRSPTSKGSSTSSTASRSAMRWVWSPARPSPSTLRPWTATSSQKAPQPSGSSPPRRWTRSAPHRRTRPAAAPSPPQRQHPLPARQR